MTSILDFGQMKTSPERPEVVLDGGGKGEIVGLTGGCRFASRFGVTGHGIGKPISNERSCGPSDRRQYCYEVG